jgi:hypothetical protein
MQPKKRNESPPVTLQFWFNNPTDSKDFKMSQNFYVYTHSLSGKPPFYVGKGNEKIIKKVARTSNPHHTHIVKKYGKENIIVKTMLCRNERHALDLEVRMIMVLRNGGVKLVNMTDGGEGASGFPMSEQNKIKMSLRHKGKVISEDLRKKMSDGHKNRPPISEETRRKKSIAAKKIGFSELAKEKMLIANTGRKKTSSEIEKRLLKIENNGGYRHTDEVKKKMSIAMTGFKRTPESVAKSVVAKKKNKEIRQREIELGLNK